jgi:rare lipoprotein A
MIASTGEKVRPLRIAAAVAVISAMVFGCAGRETAPPHSPAPASGGTTAPPKVGTKPYRVGSTWYHPLPHAHGFTQRGLASWYGKDFHGRKTSNGETYNMYAMTAAHKTLPLGTRVQVKNLTNGRSAVVRVNDRGPFVRGRIIDLSYAAAGKLGIVGPGTAPVEIIALVPAGTDASAGVDFTRGNFTFQVGAFKNRENAFRLKNRLSEKYKNAHVVVFATGADTYFRVRVGRCSTLAQAEEYERILLADGFSEVFIVAE